MDYSRFFALCRVVPIYFFMRTRWAYNNISHLLPIKIKTTLAMLLNFHRKENYREKLKSVKFRSHKSESISKFTNQNRQHKNEHHEDYVQINWAWICLHKVALVHSCHVIPLWNYIREHTHIYDDKKRGGKCGDSLIHHNETS